MSEIEIKKQQNRERVAKHRAKKAKELGEQGYKEHMRASH
jgi:hypothetical protein